MTNKPGEYAWIPCRICGSMVLTTAPRTTCDECRVEMARECNKRKARNRHWKTLGEYMVKLIYDPIPIEEGGFPRGAKFSWEEFEKDLARGNHCEGTIIEKKGRRQTVKKVKGYYKLIALEG